MPNNANLWFMIFVIVALILLLLGLFGVIDASNK
jgi:hypothetical protein